MKTKLITLAFAIFTLVFLFAISSGAQEVCAHDSKEIVAINYEDYSKAGKMTFSCPDCAETEMEISALITFNGYSKSEDNDSICSGYTVNYEMVKECVKLNPNFQFGVVAASKTLLGENTPLDSKTAVPVDLSEYGASVLKSILTHKDSRTIEIRLVDFSEEFYGEKLYLSAYVFDGNSVKYIQNEAKEEASTISFGEIRGSYGTKIDGVFFSTIKPATTIANDRQKQMNYSASDYNTGSTYTADELKGVVSETNKITNFLVALVFPNASAFMKHYLGNTGNVRTINMSDSSFFNCNDTKNHRITRMNQAMRVAEELAVINDEISIYQETEQVNHFADTKADWRLAIGSYFTCIEMHNVKVTVAEDGTRTYSANVNYTVTDFYNWDENKTWAVNSLLDISEKDLHNLHKAGMAKEFESHGTVTYSITWTEGQSFADIY